MTDPEAAPCFLGLPQSPLVDADVVLLALPFEGTVSYGRGTSAGPQAILNASTQVELWDEELNVDLEACQFHTLPALWPREGELPAGYLQRVESTARAVHAESGGCLLIGLGGEHSVTPRLVRAARGDAGCSGLTVVQIDAHADLRQEYEGSPDSHATAMRQLTEQGAALIAIGIRSCSREEAEYAQQCGGQIATYRAQSLDELPELTDALIGKLRSLAGDVYVTVDVDGLCTSLSPATGTPEPGGLSWWQTMRILRSVLRDAGHANVTGLDIVETVPHRGSQTNEFTAARLAAKAVAYWRSR